MQENNNGHTPQAFGSKLKMWAVSPKDFLFKYLRYIPLLLISVALFLSLAYLKIRYSMRIYRVQSSMLIKNDNDFSQKDERFQDLFLARDNNNSLGNEIEILKSSPVFRRIVTDLNLQTRYFNKGNVLTGMLYPKTPFHLVILSMADSSRSYSYKVVIQSDTKFLLNEETKPYTFGQIIEKDNLRFMLVRNNDVDLRSFSTMEFAVSWMPAMEVAQGLMGGLKVFQINDQSTILTLTYEGENSALGKDIVNTLMAVYDTMTVEDKNRIAANTLKFIQDRLRELDDTLRGVEGGLRSFMAENQVFDIDNQSKSYLENLTESDKQKNQIEVRILIVDHLMEYISDKKNTHELVPTILGIDEPALLQRVSEYNRIQLERDNNLKTTPASNPMIIAMDNSLDKVRRDIYEALVNVKQAYQIAANNMERHQGEIQGHITALPGKSMQLLNKERQQKILEDLYSLLLQKKLDISLSSASTISNSRVVEPATASPAPISPNGKQTYVLYLLFGIIIPIGFVAVKEVLQDKITSRADVEKITETPIVGDIGHSEGEQPLVVRPNSRRLISEQFRIIRTNLQYITGKRNQQVIMVTSSFSGEGKSFISTNMGAVMALSGKKTVIMEFDIRKPKIVSALDLKRKMGITNYIIGKATFEDLLVGVQGIDDLYVIPCGPIPPNPAELLLDPRLDQLMKEVKEHFDVVIMDTAPVGLVSDATNLGRFADCTMYIVRYGYTFRHQIRFIDDLYVQKKLPSLCLVMNDVKTNGGYYGGGYYGRGYGYYGNYGYGVDSGYFEEENNKNGKMTLSGRFRKMWKSVFG